MEGGVRAAANDTRSGGVAGAGGAGSVFQIVQIRCFFTVLGDSGDTPVQCFVLLFHTPLM